MMQFIANTVQDAERLLKSATADTSTPMRTHYPRDPEGQNTNVTNLSGAHSYPNDITVDPKGFVNYMPYAHGKPQAGMADDSSNGVYNSNPLQMNLHMPSDLTDSVTAKWEADADIFAKSSQLGATEALKGTVKQALKKVGTDILGKGAEIVTGGQIDAEKLKKGFERQQGHAIRPFESQFFQGVDYRTFEFTHKLIAFEPDDTITINKIIKMFRYHSSPGTALNGVMYEYPSSWRIRFYHGNPDTAQVKESEWLPTLKRCVLGKVEVKHFASDTPSYHTNFAPVDIEISLSFQEMEYITKKSILKETQPVW